MTEPTRRHPLVSVVLPVRDGAATLDAALESLRAQTFPHFEVLIVDDGSRDDSPLIARAWEQRDGRFRLLRDGPGHAASPHHCFAPPRDTPFGIVAALQRGLAASHGPYIARMDADDRCHLERLTAQLDLLERSPALAGCGAGVRYVPESTVTPRAAEYAAWLNSMITWETVAANIFVECPLAHPTFMFRRSALATVGGYRNRDWPEDYDLLLRLWRTGHRFVSLPRVPPRLGQRTGPTEPHPPRVLAGGVPGVPGASPAAQPAHREGRGWWCGAPDRRGRASRSSSTDRRCGVAGFIEVDPAQDRTGHPWCAGT